MSDVVIKVNNLSKKYRLGSVHGDLLSEHLGDGLRSFFNKLRGNVSPLTFDLSQEKDFWALRDISFEVKQGEVVGIIGRNGAGKSTLLKILSKITPPTLGRVEMVGRVASLLEVGTGFHPELTGRENIFLNGAILGMGKMEIRKKFDDIVAFAEVEKFIDTPVKRYSSGMYVRLAFAVAAHLEPEILIVDEVLAVGDAQFQKKCLGKMGDVAKEGRTVLFVSHNMNAVAQLCNIVAWFDQGELLVMGEAHHIVGRYLSSGVTDQIYWIPCPSENKAFRYHSVKVSPLNSKNDSKSVILSADEPFEVVFEFTVEQDLPTGRLALSISNQDGIVVVASADTDATPCLNRKWNKGRQVIRCLLPGHFFVPGKYFITIPEPRLDGGYDIHENIITFTISNQNSLVNRDKRPGVIAPILAWRWQCSD